VQFATSSFGIQVGALPSERRPVALDPTVAAGYERGPITTAKLSRDPPQGEHNFELCT